MVTQKRGNGSGLFAFSYVDSNWRWNSGNDWASSWRACETANGYLRIWLVVFSPQLIQSRSTHELQLVTTNVILLAKRKRCDNYTRYSCRRQVIVVCSEKNIGTRMCVQQTDVPWWLHREMCSEGPAALGAINCPLSLVPLFLFNGCVCSSTAVVGRVAWKWIILEMACNP